MKMAKITYTLAGQKYEANVKEILRDQGYYVVVTDNGPVVVPESNPVLKTTGVLIVTGKQIGRASCRERVCLYV